jgi:hypothetical protein
MVQKSQGPEHFLVLPDKFRQLSGRLIYPHKPRVAANKGHINPLIEQIQTESGRDAHLPRTYWLAVVRESHKK